MSHGSIGLSTRIGFLSSQLLPARLILSLKATHLTMVSVLGDLLHVGHIRRSHLCRLDVLVGIYVKLLFTCRGTEVVGFTFVL